MDIKAVPLNKFFKNKESVYKNIMIVAARARQIVDERYEKVAAMDDIEDTDELIDLEVEDFNQDKSISIAMDELINNDLEYRTLEEDNNEERDI
tara:strand:+ start:9704 stop:9985 length:282 start_codon:yes stop_codon:yes gene_type:complete